VLTDLIGKNISTFNFNPTVVIYCSHLSP